MNNTLVAVLGFIQRGRTTKTDPTGCKNKPFMIVEAH